jgi:hypothetical protein
MRFLLKFINSPGALFRSEQNFNFFEYSKRFSKTCGIPCREALRGDSLYDINDGKEMQELAWHRDSFLTMKTPRHMYPTMYSFRAMKPVAKIHFLTMKPHRTQIHCAL